MSCYIWFLDMFISVLYICSCDMDPLTGGKIRYHYEFHNFFYWIHYFNKKIYIYLFLKFIPTIFFKQRVEGSKSTTMIYGLDFWLKIEIDLPKLVSWIDVFALDEKNNNKKQAKAFMICLKANFFWELIWF